MGRIGRIGRIAWLIVVMGGVAGCWYTAPTGRKYMLRVDPATVELVVGQGVNFSNYVGYCLAVGDVRDDVGYQEALQLLEEKLQRHGYVKVSKEELLAERGLLSNVFVVELTYAGYFEEGELEVRLTLYEFEGGGKSERVIWSWRSRVNEYPISRANIKPVLEDIFDTEPMGWGEDERLLPKMAAGEGTVKAFYEALERARAAVRLRPGGQSGQEIK